MWYVKDLNPWYDLEGPFSSYEDASNHLKELIGEGAIADDSSPYLEYLPEGYYNIEDWEYDKYKDVWEHDLEYLEELPTKEKIRK